MTSPGRLLLIAALASAAACGPSREERLMDEREAVCNGLVAQGATIRDALSQIGTDFVCQASTATTQPPLGANDACGGAPVLQVLLIYPVTDASLCHTSPGGGCGFFCEIRVTDAAAAAAGGLIDAPICASQWWGGVCASACGYALC